MQGPSSLARAQRGVFGVKAPNLAIQYWPRMPVISQHAEPVVIISHRLIGTKTHFFDGRTCACTEDAGPCWLDHKLHGGGRYEGWLAVYSIKWKRNYLLSLTKVAVKMCPLLEDDGFDLRGRTLEVWRKYAGVRAPMRCRLCDTPPNETNLDLAPALPPLIERMWAAADRGDSFKVRRRRVETSSLVAAGVRPQQRPGDGVCELGDLFGAANR